MKKLISLILKLMLLISIGHNLWKGTLEFAVLLCVLVYVISISETVDKLMSLDEAVKWCEEGEVK